MKTKILLATALLAVSSVSSADTLSNLLNDIPKNVSFVEQTGNCDANGEIQTMQTNNNGYTSSRDVFVATDDACAPVIVSCGKGKTILPSTCELTYSDGTKPIEWMSSESEVSHTDFVNGTQSCNIEIPFYRTLQYQPMDGYTTRGVTIKATARCIKTPANLIQNTAKKLGITIK